MATAKTPDPPSNSRPQYPIESVDNALRLLLMFRDRAEIRLSEAHEALGVAQSTAHRLMAMLAYHNFVRQDPLSRAYRAGPALIDVGLSVVRGMDIRSIARPFLEELMQQVGETVHLATLEGAGARFLDAVESEHTLRVAGGTGRVLPAHAVSAGKAMLAALPDDEIDRLYPSDPLPAQTDRTITTREQLKAELQRVRRRGFASNAGESEDGVSSTGVAVLERQWPPGGRGERRRPAEPDARLDGPAGGGAADRDRPPHRNRGVSSPAFRPGRKRRSPSQTLAYKRTL